MLYWNFTIIYETDFYETCFFWIDFGAHPVL